MGASLHPYLSSTDDPAIRLVRAHYWFVVDMNCNHTAYWRDQIAQCEAAYTAYRSAQYQSRSQAERDHYSPPNIGRELLDFVRLGYEAAARKPWGGKNVSIPELSCS